MCVIGGVFQLWISLRSDDAARLAAFSAGCCFMGAVITAMVEFATRTAIRSMRITIEDASKSVAELFKNQPWFLAAEAGKEDGYPVIFIHVAHEMVRSADGPLTTYQGWPVVLRKSSRTGVSMN